MIEVKKIENNLPEDIKKIFFGKHFSAKVGHVSGGNSYTVTLSDFLEKLSEKEKEAIESLIEEVSESKGVESFVFTSEEAEEVNE